MPESLNVIALISGGKDSLYSLLHCVQNGHKVVALANLYPPDQSRSQGEAEFDATCNEARDLDSFMYQTVGHSIIPLYSTVLQIPLYRRQITGSSIQQSQYYDTSRSNQISDHDFHADETEDLVPLLREVLVSHTEANAVSTGAILSTYQRTRVESIAIRLGLTPLSYLWQYPVLPQRRSDTLTGLLEDVSSSGLDARIIKIASAGIPENLLFANVSDTRTHSGLVNGLAPFFEENDEAGLRGAVLGEGGEYETIALNGPREIWKGGRIEIDEAGNDPYSQNGVVYMRFGKARVVPHSEMTATGKSGNERSSALVVVPTLLDPQFERVKKEVSLASLSTPKPTNVYDGNSAASGHNREPEDIRNSFRWCYTASASTVTISNLTALSIISTSDQNTTTASSSLTAAIQMRMILDSLPTFLSRVSKLYNLPNLSTSDISSTILLLKSMSEFATVNPIYSQIYPAGVPNPPSRATIACPLPPNIQVSLSMTLDIGSTKQRQGLHVQGRSYWAPANIGPYSQAITVPINVRSENDRSSSTAIATPDDEQSTSLMEIVYIAGQIPLVPATMEVQAGSFLDSAVLGLQHLWRIGQERRVDIWPWGIAYLAKHEKPQTIDNTATAAATWTQAHLKPTWPLTPEHSTDTDNDNDLLDSDNESPTVDIWDLQRNRSQYTGFRQSKITIGKHLHILPNHSVFTTTQSRKQKPIPPFIAAEITTLPRNVDIEWWTNGIAGLTKSTSPPSARPAWTIHKFTWGTISHLTVTPHASRQHEKVSFITYLISPSSLPNPELPTTISSLLRLINPHTKTSGHLAQGTTFLSSTALQSNIWSHFSAANPTNDSSSQHLSTSTAIIPCYTLWGQCASTVKVGTHEDDKTQNETGRVEELALAFILRVNLQVEL